MIPPDAAYSDSIMLGVLGHYGAYGRAKNDQSDPITERNADGPVLRSAHSRGVDRGVAPALRCRQPRSITGVITRSYVTALRQQAGT